MVLRLLPPTGHLAMLETFMVVKNWGQKIPLAYSGKTKNTANYPTLHKKVPQNKELSDSNITVHRLRHPTLE